MNKVSLPLRQLLSENVNQSTFCKAFRKYEFENVGLTSEDLEIGFKAWKRELEKVDPAIRLYESVKEVEKNISEGNGAYFTSGSYKKHVLSKFAEERLTEESKDVLSEFNKKFNTHSLLNVKNIFIFTQLIS